MKSLNNITDHGIAFDNIYSKDVKLEQLLQPYPLYMNVHLDIVCVEGSYTFEYGGALHECEKGTITIFVKDSFCQFKHFSDDCKIAVLISDTSKMHRGATQLHNLILFLHYVKQSPTFQLSDSEMEAVLGVYRIVKNFSQKKESYSYYDEIFQLQHLSLFYLLFEKVGMYQIEKSNSVAYNKSICRTFMNNVSKHFREERSLGFYAELQCITAKHLSSAVKKESGITAHEIISDYVMIEAKALLSDQSLSILDISEKLHFPNQSFFGKFFKAHEGMSPLQYRSSITI